MKFVLTAEGDLATFSQNHKTKHFKSCNVELAANQVSVLSFSPDHVRVVGGGGGGGESLRQLPGAKSIDYRVVVLFFIDGVVVKTKESRLKVGRLATVPRCSRAFLTGLFFYFLFLGQWKRITTVHECQGKSF